MATMTKVRTVYAAFYEDAKKVEAAAKARGFTGADGECWHDFIDAQSGFNTVARFNTLREAISWLRAEVKAYKSVYGVGTVRLIELVEHPDRCRYCVCNGRRASEEWTVTDDGIEQHDVLDSPCVD